MRVGKIATQKNYIFQRAKFCKQGEAAIRTCISSSPRTVLSSRLSALQNWVWGLTVSLTSACAFLHKPALFYSNFGCLMAHWNPLTVVYLSGDLLSLNFSEPIKRQTFRADESFVDATNRSILILPHGFSYMPP